MRTLNKNKVQLWLIEPSGLDEIVNSDGFFTGEYTKIYSPAIIIFINLYPANGNITTKLFGKDYECDMVAVSNDVVLTKDSLLFSSVPLSNYDKTYDYTVDNISKSLNTYNYGLKARV